MIIEFYGVGAALFLFADIVTRAYIKSAEMDFRRNLRNCKIISKPVKNLPKSQMFL